MAGIIKTTKSNCTEDSSVSYSVSGVPLTTSTVFTKTFTITSGHQFLEAPSINLNNVSDKNSYSVTISDTGSISGDNLTARAFAVKYKVPLKEVVGDKISFIARAGLDITNSTGKIYGYSINENQLLAYSEKRVLTIYGDATATLTLDVKNASNASIVGGSSTVTIGSNGTFTKEISFPASIANTTYSIVMTQIASNSFLTMSTPKTVTLNQRGYIATTINFVESANNFIVTQASVVNSDIAGSTRGTEYDFDWAVTSRSVTRTLKNKNELTAGSFTGTNSGEVNTLTGGTKVSFSNLFREIFPTTTRTTGSGTTATTAVVLSSANAAIAVGMRVTSTNINRADDASCIVTAVSGTSVTLSATPNGTIAAGENLTFHHVMNVTGNVRIEEVGTSAQTCSLDAANILNFNEAPTATPQTSATAVAVTTNVTKSITLAGTDPENDTLTFTIKRLPAHGTLVYIAANNNSTSQACGGETVTLVLGNSKIITYTSATNNNTDTNLQFLVSDGQQDSSNASVTLTITNA